MDNTAQPSSPTQDGSQQPASPPIQNATPPVSTPTSSNPPVNSDSSGTNGGNTPPHRNFKKIGFYLILLLVIIAVAIFAYQSTKPDTTIEDSQNALLVSQDQNLSQDISQDLRKTPEHVVCARFDNLEDALYNKDKACVLDLSNQELEEVPEGVYSLPSLIEIDLSNNNLTDFPTKLLDMPKMASIDLDNNQISSFTPPPLTEPVLNNEGELVVNIIQSISIKKNILNEDLKNQLSSYFGGITSIIF